MTNKRNYSPSNPNRKITSQTKVTPKIESQIVQMVLSGDYFLSDIATALGLSTATIHHWVKKNNLKRTKFNGIFDDQIKLRICEMVKTTFLTFQEIAEMFNTSATTVGCISRSNGIRRINPDNLKNPKNNDEIWGKMRSPEYIQKAKDLSNLKIPTSELEIKTSEERAKAIAVKLEAKQAKALAKKLQQQDKLNKLK